MSPVRLVVSLLAALALLAPSATAASALGELESGAMVLPQGASLASAGLDILAESETVPAMNVDARGVSVHRLGSSEVRVGDVYRITNEEINDRAEYETATLTFETGEGVQIVALRSTGPATADLLASNVLPVNGATLAAVQSSADSCDSLATGAEEAKLYCHEVLGVYEIAGEASAVVSGEIILLIYGPTLSVTSDGTTTEYPSGVTATQNGGATTEDAWVVLTAASVTGTFSAGSARLYSAAPTLTTTRVELPAADGIVRVGGRDYRAADDTVVAAGALVLSPGAVVPAAADTYDAAPLYASSFTTRISGDVATINLNSAPAYLDSNAERVGLAAILALLIAGAAYAWQHISFLAAAMYTRLNKPDILDNDVRNRIYDIIRENPGISAREVHRRSEQSWGTVVYHLRQLERHHLVVSRSLGRTRNYYENHGKYRGMEVQLACLQSDRARVLARAIAGTPGITQEQLAGASGFPQPTTSYYVRKLKQAGLVEEQREGRYVKYVPHADLPRFIAMSEQSPVVAAAPSGVQA